jgi:mannose-6-phosphate isomerase-like protein (cupin superfamily)
MADYQINTDVRFGPLSRVDLDAVRAGFDHPWVNQTLLRINESVLRLGVVKGEFHWHRHEESDELFYVVEGVLHVDIEGEPSQELGPRQAILVPKGKRHRTRAPDGVMMLMIGAADLKPIGD